MTDEKLVQALKAYIREWEYTGEEVRLRKLLTLACDRIVRPLIPELEKRRTT